MCESERDGLEREKRVEILGNHHQYYRPGSSNADDRYTGRRLYSHGVLREAPRSYIFPSLNKSSSQPLALQRRMSSN